MAFHVYVRRLKGVSLSRVGIYGFFGGIYHGLRWTHRVTNS